MKSICGIQLRLFLLIGLMVLLEQTLIAQEIIYSYDSNGNRILRSIVLLKSGHLNDTLYEDKQQKEIFKETIEQIQIHIFPNPTSGNLKIEVTGLLIGIPIEFSVYSTIGTLLNKQKTPEHDFLIDFENYASGTYILKLNMEGKVSEWKIIKE